MKMQVIGVQKVDYLSRRTNEPVKGVTLFVSYPDSQVDGLATDRVFVSERLGLDFSGLDIGCTIDVEYNRRGYVQDVQVC